MTADLARERAHQQSFPYHPLRIVQNWETNSDLTTCSACSAWLWQTCDSLRLPPPWLKQTNERCAVGKPKEQTRKQELDRCWSGTGLQSPSSDFALSLPAPADKDKRQKTKDKRQKTKDKRQKTKDKDLTRNVWMRKKPSHSAEKATHDSRALFQLRREGSHRRVHRVGSRLGGTCTQTHMSLPLPLPHTRTHAHTHTHTHAHNYTLTRQLQRAFPNGRY